MLRIDEKALKATWICAILSLEIYLTIVGRRGSIITARILLIDDDVHFCDYVRMLLSRQGFDVEVAHDALSGLKLGYSCNPDLVLLDIMMPGMDGRETLRRFREMSDVPVMMLTALNSKEDMIRGLELGADEYLTKPVTGGELVARIQAVLRRFDRSGPLRHRASLSFVHDDLVVNLDRHEVTLDGERVDLTPNEFALLAVLVRNRGRVLTQEFLLREVWGPEFIDDKNYLRLYIRYLRVKLEKDPSHPCLIRTEWGIGYRFG
jgi:DNA-binding response OmpR family regulator